MLCIGPWDVCVSLSVTSRHTQALRDYQDKYPDLHFQINTFGFGYNLDSELLLALAEDGNGTVAFM